MKNITRRAFNAANIDTVPDVSGVYFLGDLTGITYIGASNISVRGRLHRHLSGQEGRCTQSALWFDYEATSCPYTTEERLLSRYHALYGRLPGCNERVS